MGVIVLGSAHSQIYRVLLSASKGDVYSLVREYLYWLDFLDGKN
jgi:hypothetical protein